MRIVRSLFMRCMDVFAVRDVGRLCKEASKICVEFKDVAATVQPEGRFISGIAHVTVRVAGLCQRM